MEKRSVESIIKDVAERHNISANDLINSRVANYFAFGFKSKDDYCIARNTLAYLLREELGLEYKEIGKIMKRDHTEIIFGHSKMKSKPYLMLLSKDL